MATKKYELTTETKVVFGRTLHRIKALVSFGDVAAGELGGWIEKEANLDHDGDAWVYGDARVCGNAWVYGDARVYGHAEVYGDARVYGDAWVYGDAEVYGNAMVTSCKAYLLFGPAGSRSDFTTFFARRDAKIGVACGCFRGDIDEFAAAVAKRHKDNEHGKVYALAIEMAKQHIVLPEVME
jgi:hypothetical protein